MEISSEGGSKIELKPSSTTSLGRGSGFDTTDLTVSRRHVLFWLKDFSNESETEPTACFEVIGRNPIWVRSGVDEKVKAFRRNERGEVAVGDWFCLGDVQSERPIWFAVKRSNEFQEEHKEMEAGESSELSSVELESVDVSSIDPIEEFDFLVIGHEFDQYPKEKIHDMKNWDWFLEEPRKDSDEDEEFSDRRKKRSLRRKRGKTKMNDDDDDWTAESEEDQEVIAKVKKIQRPIYSTRSKDRDKHRKDLKSDRSLVQKKATPVQAEGSNDEDDPTLGGFIVDDEDEGQELESDMDQEEEEEFDDNGDD